jgi:hypothetical protein
LVLWGSECERVEKVWMLLMVKITWAVVALGRIAVGLQNYELYVHYRKQALG